MQVIVVTGGLGSGKSTAAEFFRSRGAVTLDLDEVAANLLAPESALLGRVSSQFGGDDVLLADGRLDRPALARAAFASPESARKLNGLVHPAVAREVAVALEQLRLMPEPPMAVVLEVPLLAEAPVLAEVADVVLAVVAPEGLRVGRAGERGFTQDEARRRIGLQASDAQRAELADVVIINDRSVEEYRSALADFWEAHVALGGGGQ
jgi:dephospho-CoA kinase